MSTQNKRNWYRIVNKADVAEVYIYDRIGAGWDGSGISAKQFAEDMTAIGANTPLTVYINSPGGDVFDGQAIHSILKRQKGDVHVQIDGIAASIASIIAMAGDTISIAENGMLMIHNAWGFSMGNASEMRKMADTLEQIDGVLVNTYADRTGQKADKLREMMAAETWMNAEEAVNLGFADKKAAPVKAAAMAFDYSRFRNTPGTLKALAPQPPEPPSLTARIADLEHWLRQSRREHAKK